MPEGMANASSHLKCIISLQPPKPACPWGAGVCACVVDNARHGIACALCTKEALGAGRLAAAPRLQRRP